MQLSTKVRYAVRAMVELADKAGGGPVKLKEIAAGQGISLKYLEQVMLPLRVGGYVRTLKGSRGGYMLSAKPEEITLLDLVQCVEGPLAPVDCDDRPEICDRSGRCAAREAWVGLKEAIFNELTKVTLADLLARQRALDRASRD